jgi:hypothetical protein
MSTDTDLDFPDTMDGDDLREEVFAAAKTSQITTVPVDDVRFSVNKKALTLNCAGTFLQCGLWCADRLATHIGMTKTFIKDAMVAFPKILAVNLNFWLDRCGNHHLTLRHCDGQLIDIQAVPIDRMSNAELINEFCESQELVCGSQHDYSLVMRLRGQDTGNIRDHVVRHGVVITNSETFTRCRSTVRPCDWIDDACIVWPAVGTFGKKWEKAWEVIAKAHERFEERLGLYEQATEQTLSSGERDVMQHTMAHAVLKEFHLPGDLEHVYDDMLSTMLPNRFDIAHQLSRCVTIYCEHDWQRLLCEMAAGEIIRKPTAWARLKRGQYLTLPNTHSTQSRVFDVAS